METDTKSNTCPHCGHTGEGVLRYYAHIGGHTEDQLIVACDSIDDCLRRQVAKGVMEHLAKRAEKKGGLDA